MVEVELPFAVTEPVPVIVELAIEAEPELNVTVPSLFTTGVAIESVLIPAEVDFNVQLEIPEVSVGEQFVYVLPVPVALKVGVTPDLGLLFVSLNVIVIDEVAVPFASTGPVPVIVELAATAASAVKLTVPPLFTTGVAIESVFTSAFVDFNVQLEIPEVSVGEQLP